MKKLNVRSYVCLMVAFVLGLACTFGVRAFADEPVVLTEVEQTIFDKINELRAKSGLPAFELCPDLTTQSRSWSRNMKERRTLYHGAGQEICANAANERAFSAWFNSPAHRAFFYRSDTKVGIGQSDDGMWWTMRGREVYRERSSVQYRRGLFGRVVRVR